ncbi:hypothetical protein BDW22DRAFT_1312177, partial [Trametopsis cervina]
LFRLRTGHAPLNKHLYRINKATSPVCPACDKYRESVGHFLLFCPAYATQRQRLYYELGGATPQISALLSTPQTLRPLFRYIHATGRFTRLLGSLNIP